MLLVFSAVASGWVKVENDVAAYLPADSEVRQGLDIMEQEFQTYGSAKILLRDTDADTAAAMAEQIRAVDGVDSCTYTMNDAGSALLSVSLSDLEGSDACAQTVQALRDLLDGSGAYIYSTEGYSISDQINGEVRGLLVIVAIILVTVLTFTSSTYAEVPILLITSEPSRSDRLTDSRARSRSCPTPWPSSCSWPCRWTTPSSSATAISRRTRPCRCAKRSSSRWPNPLPSSAPRA